MSSRSTGRPARGVGAGVDAGEERGDRRPAAASSVASPRTLRWVAPRVGPFGVRRGRPRVSARIRVSGVRSSWRRRRRTAVGAPMRLRVGRACRSSLRPSRSISSPVPGLGTTADAALTRRSSATSARIAFDRCAACARRATTPAAASASVTTAGTPTASVADQCAGRSRRRRRAARRRAPRAPGRRRPRRVARQDAGTRVSSARTPSTVRGSRCCPRGGGR